MPNPYVSRIQLGSSIHDIYDEAAHEQITNLNNVISADFVDTKAIFTPNNNITSVGSDNFLTFRKQPLGSSGHFIYSVFGYMEAVIQDMSKVKYCELVTNLPSLGIGARIIYNVGSYTVSGASAGDPSATAPCYLEFYDVGTALLRLERSIEQTSNSAITYRCSTCFIV